MPTIDLPSVINLVSNLAVVVAVIWYAAIKVSRWLGWEGQKGGPVLVTEKSCQAKHEATDERISRIESKLDVLIGELARFFGELREMQGRQEERDLQAAGPRRPRKRT